MNSANIVAEKLEELSVNDDKTKSSEDKKEEAKKEEKAVEEKKWAQERRFIRILHLPFSPFLQQTLKMKNWTLFFFFLSFFLIFLFGLLTSQDLGATLKCVHFSNFKMLWAFVPFTNSHIALHFLIHCGPVVSHHVFVYLHDMQWYKACAIDWFPHWVTSFVVFFSFVL